MSKKVTIEKVEKVKDREDISLYRATLSDKATVDVEADSKKEAEDKVKEFLSSSLIYNK